MRQLIFMMFCLSTLCSAAQEYISFPDSVASWHSKIYYSPDMDVSFQYGHSYRIQGDTLVDGVEYSKLFTRHTFEIADDPPFPYNESYYTLEQEPYFLIGGLREDSVHKVWYQNFNFEEWWSADNRAIFDAIADSSEVLLYDFDLLVGDSIYFYNPGDYVTVTNVEIDVIDRVTIRFYYPLTGSEYEWTQGMGSRYSSLFSRFDLLSGGFAPGAEQELLCLSVNGEVVYGGWGQYDCDGVFTSLEKFSNGQLATYPNPTTGDLRVGLRMPGTSASLSALYLALFDARGREVPESKFQVQDSADGESLNLNIEGLPNGLYILRLLTQDGVYSSRIMKE